MQKYAILAAALGLTMGIVVAVLEIVIHWYDEAYRKHWGVHFDGSERTIFQYFAWPPAICGEVNEKKA